MVYRYLVIVMASLLVCHDFTHCKEYDCYSNPMLPLYYQQSTPNQSNAIEDELLLQAMDLAKKEILYILKLKKDKVDREALKDELYANCPELLYHKSTDYVDSKKMIVQNH